MEMTAITKKGRRKMEILDKMGSIAVMVDDSQVRDEANDALNDIADVRASVSLKTRDKEIELPDALSRLVMSVIEGVSKGDTVTISTIPEEISAPTAASMLGISRPTFLKWAKERNLTTKKVGSQKRFLSKEVMELRRNRIREQLKQFEDLQRQMEEYGV